MNEILSTKLKEVFKNNIEYRLSVFKHFEKKSIGHLDQSSGSTFGRQLILVNRYLTRIWQDVNTRRKLRQVVTSAGASSQQLENHLSLRVASVHT